MAKAVVSPVLTDQSLSLNDPVGVPPGNSLRRWVPVDSRLGGGG
jgi:hypothetical protein